MESNSQELSCFTIGHGNLPVAKFIGYLDEVCADCIIDVRSTPYSKYLPEYNRENISTQLEQENIEYCHMGNVIGGIYSEPSLLFPDGTADYQKVSKTPEFIKGLETVIDLIKDGKRIALMCSEKDPIRCHRFLLIARNLQVKGVNVIHLHPEETEQGQEIKWIKESNDELERRLLGIGKDQIRLMDDKEEVGLKYACKDQNKKIARKNPQNEKTSQKTLF